MNVNSGQSVFIEMLITDTDASTPLTAEGLLTAGGRLIQSSGVAAVSKAGATAAHVGFDAVNQNPATVAPEIAAFLAATTNLAPLTGIGAGLTSIVVATFEVQATGAGGDTASISAALLGNGLIGNTTYVNLTDLDGPLFTFGSVNLTINSTSVPEPASIVLGGCTAAFAGLAAWRKRRTPIAQKVDTAV